MSSDLLKADIDAINAPYWKGLMEGRLLFQRCSGGHAWLPARALCPTCLSKEWQWQAAAGNGRILSWVIYHHAYHPAFKERLPYNVALVQLEEGPRLLTNILAPNDALAPDLAVRLAIDTSAAQPLATFELVDSKPPVAVSA